MIWLFPFFLAILSTGVLAKPCPESSLFLHSYQHEGESHCACIDGTRCVGSSCTVGGASNEIYGFYHTQDHSGFRSSCLDCYCLRPDESEAEVEASATHKMLTSTTGEKFRDFRDPLFEASCRVDDTVPIPQPRALARQKWLHFPKVCASLHALAVGLSGRLVFSPRWLPSMWRSEAVWDGCERSASHRIFHLLSSWRRKTRLLVSHGNSVLDSWSCFFARLARVFLRPSTIMRVVTFRGHGSLMTCAMSVSESTR